MPLTSYQHQESWRSLRRASRCLSYCPSGSGEEGCSGIDRLEGRLSNLDPELSDSTRGEAEKQLRPCAVAEAHPKGVNVGVQLHHVEKETPEKFEEDIVSSALLLALPRYFSVWWW